MKGIRIGTWIHKDAEGATKLLKIALNYISKQAKEEVVIHVPEINTTALKS